MLGRIVTAVFAGALVALAMNAGFEYAGYAYWVSPILNGLFTGAAWWVIVED